MFVSTEAVTRSNTHHKDRVNINSSVKLALTAAVLLAFAPVQAQTMGKADYNAARTCISADFKSDKAACASRSGNAKDICVEEAKAIEVKALADARMGKEIGEARSDAATTRQDADYKVAVEKCDAMAGDAKASCLAAVKASFGKS